MSQKLNGFVVVRRPEECGVMIGNKWYPQPALIEGSKYYGLSRSQWEDVENAHYAKELNSTWENIYQNINKSFKETFLGVKLSRDIREAQDTLEFSNKISPQKNELIAFHAKLITEIQGEFESETKIKWIGYDVVEIGCYSLIRLGIFECKSFFNKWKNVLNEYGLIPEGETVHHLKKKLLEDYKTFQEKNLIETRPIIEENTDLFKIGLTQH